MSAAPTPPVTLVGGVSTYTVTSNAVGIYELTDAFGNNFTFTYGQARTVSLTGAQYADTVSTLGSGNVVLIPGPPVTSGSGTFTANGASSVTVANTNVTATSAIIFTLKTVGGTVGAHPVVKTITAGTGFTVAATASDTSVYNYLILN